MRLQNLPEFSPALAFLGILAAFLGVIPSNALAQPVKLDDLIERHLESIGPAESRRAVKSLVISGTGAITCHRGCLGSIQGPATGRLCDGQEAHRDEVQQRLLSR